MLVVAIMIAGTVALFALDARERRERGLWSEAEAVLCAGRNCDIAPYVGE